MIYEYVPQQICLKILRLQRGYTRIFLIRYVLKAEASRPGAPKRIYAYIPYKTCLKA